MIIQPGPGGGEDFFEDPARGEHGGAGIHRHAAAIHGAQLAAGVGQFFHHGHRLAGAGQQQRRRQAAHAGPDDDNGGCPCQNALLYPKSKLDPSIHD
jgi:hypothetical protein